MLIVSFLHGIPKEEVFMVSPPEFNREGGPQSLVSKLNKSIMNWNKTLDNGLGNFQMYNFLLVLFN